MALEPLSAELRAFLHGETEATAFHHADHVRMAFEIVRRHPNFLDAARAYSSALKAIAARAGNPGAYHETITLAFLSVIAERMAPAANDDFDAFAAANGDLLDKHILARWYGAERLASALARRTFLLPAAP